jgi:nucleotide-binding universal stress UspA family protein
MGYERKVKGKVSMFDHILVPLDGSALAEKVLPHVVLLARSFDSRVTLLQVVDQQCEVEKTETVDPLHWEMRKSEAQAYLKETEENLTKVNVNVERIISEGDAAERIVDFARTEEVDLIVLSSHGRGGLSQWNINSVVQKVILRAFVPTLIVRAYQPVTDELVGLKYNRVMVPLDGSKRAEYVLPMAVSLARSQDCKLLLAHALEDLKGPGRIALTEEEKTLIDRLTELNRQQAQKYMKDIASTLSGDVETYVLHGGSITTQLHELVDEQDVDLVALNAHGFSGEARWPYGSVALNFIAYGTTPLLIMQDLETEEVETTEAAKSAQERRGH